MIKRLKAKYFTQPSMLVILFLIIIGFILSLVHLFNIENAFTVLSYSQDKPNAKVLVNTPEYITLGGSFRAVENNLGSFMFRLNLSPHLGGELFEFKIKEKGQKQWYYTQKNRISSRGFDPLFPVGFPIIANSKNKMYEYEITIYEELVSFPNKNLLQITDFKTKYQYPKNMLLSDKEALYEYMIKKIDNVVSSAHFASIPLFYFLPAIYLIYLRFFQLSLFKFYTLFSFVVFTEIFYLPVIIDIFYIITIVLWIHYCYFFKIDERISFVISIFLIGITSFSSLIAGNTIPAEKASIWAYMFLLGGVILLIMKYGMRKISLS